MGDQKTLTDELWAIVDWLIALKKVPFFPVVITTIVCVCLIKVELESIRWLEFISQLWSTLDIIPPPIVNRFFFFFFTFLTFCFSTLSWLMSVSYFFFFWDGFKAWRIEPTQRRWINSIEKWRSWRLRQRIPAPPDVVSRVPESSPATATATFHA